MRGLPELPRGQSNYDKTLFRFGGMKRRKAAGDGEAYDVYNMTHDDYPALSARLPRSVMYEGYHAVYGVGSVGDTLFWCADNGRGAKFYIDGEPLFDVAESQKRFAVIGQYVTVWPDAKYASLAKAKNPESPYETLDALYDAFADSRTIEDGDVYAVGTSRPYHLFSYNSAGKYKKGFYYEGESYGFQTMWTYLMDEWGDLAADASISGSGKNLDLVKSGSDGLYHTLINDQTTPKLTFLRPGDVVRVTIRYGRASDNRVRKVYTTRLTEVRMSGIDEAYVFDASFAISVDGLDAYSASVSRYIPPLTHVFCHDNRLFGCADGRIWASALGDPFNFLDYSLLASASYTLAVAGADFTGAVSYGGYPTFFTENSIYRLSGAYPSEYRLLSTMSVPGVSRGSGDSPAVADGVLYYLSSAGVCAYTGSYPRLLSLDIDDVPCGAVGGASSTGYYLCGKDGMLVYDTRYGLWHREDGDFTSFTQMGSALYAATATSILCLNSGEEEEEDVHSALEFAPFYDGHTGIKGLTELRVVLEAPRETALTLSISRSGGPYQVLSRLEGEGRRTHVVPVSLSREAFYQIKIEGHGPWTLYALGRHQYYGTNRP